MGREMQYERGVPLTEEEKAGGGKGAGRIKKPVENAGGNPNVPAGAFGGAADAGKMVDFGNLEDPLRQILYGRQPANDQKATMQLARDMMEMWAQSQEPISQTLTTQKMLKDPVGYANKMASLPAEAPGSTNPFAPGGAFAGRRAADLYTPEQIVASGGMTAENQLRSQQKKTDTFDPEELKRLNAQHRRTYM